MKNNVNFFFDTADIDWLSKTYRKLKPYITSDCIAGVTTNPSAFSKKIGMKRLSEWIERSNEIVKWMEANEIGGDFYIQAPNSKMTPYQLTNYAYYISANIDGYSDDEWGIYKPNIGMKIPPYKSALEHASELSKIISVNVTGVAECATALYASSFEGIDYVSIIPGRMEEKGLNANAHMSYLMSSRLDNKIITGAMRTKEGLKRAIDYGTVPTIGTTLFDSILDEIGAEGFVNLWGDKIEGGDVLAPQISEEYTELSTSFFEEMDGHGQQAYEDFLTI